MLKPSTTAALLVALVSALVPASGSAYIPRPPIASADEAEGPKTRVRGINSAAGTCVGAEEPASLELHCGICEAWLGTASGFSIYANGNPLRYTDPTGEAAGERTIAQVNLKRIRGRMAELEGMMRSYRRTGDSRFTAAHDEFITQGEHELYYMEMLGEVENAAFAHRNIGVPVAGAGVVLATGGTAVGVSAGGGTLAAFLWGGIGLGAGGGAIRQGAQIADQTRASFSWGDFSQDAGWGGAMGPMAYFAPVRVAMIGGGLWSAGNEYQQGHKWTAAFDLTASLLGVVGETYSMNQRAMAPVRASLWQTTQMGADVALNTAPQFSLASGGRTARWMWDLNAIPENQAEAAYESIRQSSTDVEAIARYQKYKASRIARIKDYLFRNPEWTDADPEIAAAWHRLRTGRGTATDLLLLKHETAEMWYRANVNNDYSPAHARANRHWNWQRAVEATNAE